MITTTDKGKLQNNKKPTQSSQDLELMSLVNKTHAILFGGAKGSSSKYDICNDSYLFKIEEYMWVKLNTFGDIPCARAAHAAACSENNHLIIFGGAVMGGGLAPDTLSLLDLSNGEDNCKWITLPTAGSLSPGKRYGHTMCYLKPYLIVFGGNIGNKITNEIWIINVDDGSLEWKKLEPNGEAPGNRMYHSSGICKHGGASGMMIVYGGRSDTGVALNDCWGLRKHRNGSWDWVKAPYLSGYAPLKRFQHSVAFYYNFLIVLGGRTDEDFKSIPIEIYDTESSEWTEMATFNKFRHASWIVDSSLFTHGGFEYTTPTVSKNDIIMIDVIKLFKTNDVLGGKLEKIIESKKNSSNAINNSGYSPVNTNKDSKKVTPSLSPTNQGGTGTDIPPKQLSGTGNLNPAYKKVGSNSQVITVSEKVEKPVIHKKGEIAIVSNKKDDKLIIKKITFDDKWKLKINNEIEDMPLHEQFLYYLLQPAEWLVKSDQSKEKFKFSIEQIMALTKQCIDIVAAQPMVLKISAPVKIFGDVHGQYIDLMNFFDKWGQPHDGMNGDIMSNDYLFLGDYVDRGNMSLETICLLIALKVKYPDQIHMLRGNHEDRLINSGFGFMDECQDRLGDDSINEDSLFAMINQFFEYLPLAAIIEDQILCLHGGIGANVNRLSDIEKIKRPFEVVHEAASREEKIVMDILWSDPTDNDEELGILPNTQRDSNNYGNIVKFGPDVVKRFLQNNNLSYIIRAHECVLDGFERFAGGALITVFSATDYCRRHNNAGAMLVINQQKAMIPHLIYPPDGGNKHWIDDDEYYKKRPPTPPRVRYNKATY